MGVTYAVPVAAAGVAATGADDAAWASVVAFGKGSIPALRGAAGADGAVGAAGAAGATCA